MNMLLPAHSEVLRSVTVSYVDAQARTRAPSARFHQWSIRVSAATTLAHRTGRLAVSPAACKQTMPSE